MNESIFEAMLTDSFQVSYSEADQALYDSKKNGRNCITVVD